MNRKVDSDIFGLQGHKSGAEGAEGRSYKRTNSDIFAVKEADASSSSSQGKLFSIGGMPSGTRNRLRSTGSNVFPVGCMGTVEDPKENPKEDPKGDPKEEVIKMEIPVADMKKGEEPKEMLSVTPRRLLLEAGDNEKPAGLPSPHLETKTKRNILTGEGVESSDMPRINLVRKKTEKTKFLY